MKNTPFSHMNFNEKEFREDDYEQIINIINKLNVEDLKLQFAFYYALYEKSEGNILSKDPVWKLLTFDMVRKYSLSQIYSYKEHYKERNVQYIHMPYEMYDCYLDTYKLFDRMTPEQHRSLIYNCFITSILIDIELTIRTNEWHPYTEYGMIMHYEYMINKKKEAV